MVNKFCVPKVIALHCGLPFSHIQWLVVNHGQALKTDPIVETISAKYDNLPDSPAIQQLCTLSAKTNRFYTIVQFCLF